MALAVNNRAVLAWRQQGGGPALLLVMGHRFSSQMWCWALDGLSSERSVICFDNRGTGASNAPPGPYSMQDLAEDAFAVMDAAGIRSAAVYGVSMGGMIAQQMALMNPERVSALILGCTAARFPRNRPPSALSYLQYWLPKSLTVRLAQKVLYGSLATAELVRQDLEIIRKDECNPRGLIGQAHAIADFNVQSRLNEIKQPTLVLHGSEDKVIPLSLGSELAAGISTSQFVVLEGSGHNYLADAADTSNEAILHFLRSVD